MNENIMKARAKLVLKFPFFGCLVLNCRMIETEEIPTAATDGRDILYNKKFISKLTVEEVTGLLAHEVLHKAFLHVLRLGEKDRYIWNCATDFAINIIIKDSKLLLPEGGLLDEKYRDMSADDIYRQLINNPEDVPTGAEEHFANEISKMSPADKKKLAAEVKTQLAQAAQIAKTAGNLPSAIAKLVKETLAPVVDWRKILRTFIQGSIKTDQSFRRPKRRTLAHDMYLPSAIGEGIPPIAIAFDTSGSIYHNQKIVDQFAGEINGIIEDCSPERVDVFYADTTVKHQDTFEKFEPFVPNLIGGGGTAFSDTFAKINESAELPSLIIYLTDLEVSDFGETDIPTLWCCYGNNPSTPPFGTVVEMKI